MTKKEKTRTHTPFLSFAAIAGAILCMGALIYMFKGKAKNPTIDDMPSLDDDGLIALRTFYEKQGKFELAKQVQEYRIDKVDISKLM